MAIDISMNVPVVDDPLSATRMVRGLPPLTLAVSKRAPSPVSGAF